MVDTATSFLDACGNLETGEVRSFLSSQYLESNQVPDPLTREELVDITDLWVEAALTLAPALRSSRMITSDGASRISSVCGLKESPHKAICLPLRSPALPLYCAIIAPVFCCFLLEGNLDELEGLSRLGQSCQRGIQICLAV